MILKTKNIIIIIIIIILLFVILSFLYKINIENFDVQAPVISQTNKQNLKDYECLPIEDNHVYGSTTELIGKNPTIKTDENIIIYIMGWPYGFGSAISVFIQNAVRLNDINSKIIVLPYWNSNTVTFKYHEDGYNNSFFLYFKYRKDVDLQKSKIYFLNDTIVDMDNLIKKPFPYYHNEHNAKFIDYFNGNFSLDKAIDDIITHSFENNKKPHIYNIGIHLRSKAPFKVNDPQYLKNDISYDLSELKKILDDKYKNYQLFIAYDINNKIEKVKNVFDNINVYDIPFISRADDDEGDSIPQLDEYKGYKLGSDILCDCKMLSLCDVLYARYSNVAYMVNILNPNIEMFEY